MNIYFSGIGGVGIGPLAEISLDAGYEISGSDVAESLMTSRLQARGVDISFDQSGSSLRARHSVNPIDWYVYTSALPVNHPELVAAQSLGIKTAKRDELLAHIIAEKNLKLIAIAGTHGKTTTTGMMVWALRELGFPVSYSVGTTLSWGPSGKYEPTSEFFVYECDEFDRNFLQFHPYLSIITNIEHDHTDTYPSKYDYFDAFSQFASQSQAVVTWNSQTTDISLPSNSWLLGDDEVQSFHLAGEHNRRNATLVSKGLEYLAVSPDPSYISDAISRFPGTNRRMEKLAENLYSDYGHTPTEIRATLQLAREISDKVVLIYQPHQNIRQHEIKEQYTDAVFAGATKIYWVPTYLSREDPGLETLTPEQLTSAMTESPVTISELDDKLWSEIVTLVNSGYLVLGMGAGSIDGWLRKNLA